RAVHLVITAAHLGVPDAQLRALEPGFGNRPGIECTDAPPNLWRILAPIDERFSLVDFLGVGDARGGLRHLADAASGKSIEGFADELSADAREPVVQGLCSVVRANVRFADRQHRA